ncbi:chromobox protein homolog 3-like isoform X2 [Hyposmocoma kahamanoa]|uniref:chromobox protein homolog 3-like isoform X2 n=1 Tax=Hyposmocoma kahamanoa TaxID=1477025 RepID=UPI000E6D82CC|nr:chromobox protein homolog 3-like isoform X2 [Hyposmocoma kahamanoa]
MRKVSKNRADDDVVSSTNGSVLNEDQVDAIKPTDNDERAQDSDDSGGYDKSDDETLNSKSSSKKSKGKKGRKRKADKKEKKHREEDNDEDGTEEEYEVEKVIDSKKIKGKLHYLIRWKGYTAESDTWEPENTLSCPELINKFIDEKENSKTKESKSPGRKVNKRKVAKKEAKSNKRPKTEWDSQNADSAAEYEVDRILEVHHKKNGERDFLIHWKGWSSKFDSWEPESNLNCSELIKKFMDKAPSSGRRLSKRRGQHQRVRYDGAE